MKAYNDIRYVLHMAVVNSCMIPRFRTHSVPTITTYQGCPEFYFWGFRNFCEDFLQIFKALNGCKASSPNLCHYLLIYFTIVTRRMRGEDSRGDISHCLSCQRGLRLHTGVPPALFWHQPKVSVFDNLGMRLGNQRSFSRNVHFVA